MKNGFVHSHVLIASIHAKAVELGFTCRREMFVRAFGRSYFADLVIETSSRRIVVEAELTPRRVHRDLVKACALRAKELWIVVPTRRVVQSVARALRRRKSRAIEPRVTVLLLDQALQRLTACCPLISEAIPAGPQFTNARPQGAGAPACEGHHAATLAKHPRLHRGNRALGPDRSFAGRVEAAAPPTGTVPARDVGDPHRPRLGRRDSPRTAHLKLLERTLVNKWSPSS